ncbi:MAG TPA: ankyrin repeat domain-containing protein [Blastocatellia bacterium]|nr:ankyrin repeat domain-containing protein [Blastocatellia bacterium]
MGEPHLSAQYFRVDYLEHLSYWPKVGDPIGIELNCRYAADELSGDLTADLLYASHMRSEDLVQLVLKRGADPNARTRYGGSILVDAAFSGPDQYEIVKLLLDAGAEINQTSASGWTALMAVIWRGTARTTNLLLQRGADINMRSQDGRTALILAVSRGNTSAVKRLLQLGADANVIDGYGKTALMIAEEVGKHGLVCLLEGAGAQQ